MQARLRAVTKTSSAAPGGWTSANGVPATKKRAGLPPDPHHGIPRACKLDDGVVIDALHVPALAGENRRCVGRRVGNLYISISGGANR